MKVTDIRTVLLTGPITNDPFLLECRHRRSAAFIEVETDTEYRGIGETYAGYFCPELVPETVEYWKPILIGQNVDDIPALWDRMYHCENFWCRVGLGASVLNGVEAALWDLKGKLENKPVYELLGGLRHQSLPCYATGGPSNYPPQKLAAKIDFYLALGFQAFKLGVGTFDAESGFTISAVPEKAAEVESNKLEFVRSHVGDEITVMIDGHMGNSNDSTWELETALAVMNAVEPYKLFFFEEPLNYTNLRGYAELCRQTSVPIAGGECLTATCEWRVFIERDAFDIGQPDASFTGGLTEFVRVAQMLEQRQRKIATHAWGAGGSLMQNIHCGFACPNTAILEIPPAFGGMHSDIIADSFHMQDGRVLPPDKPGLGIVLTDDIKNRYPFVRGSGSFNSVPEKYSPIKMKKILIDFQIHKQALQHLQTMPGVQVQTVAPALEARVLPTELVADAQILFCTFPPSNLAEMKSLEWVQIGSVGYEHLYGLGLAERNIKICNGRGVFDPTIAEWNMAMMINLLRDIRAMIRNQEHGIWNREAKFESELRGLTVGIWGYGGIGRATARLANAFGMKVHVLTRNGISEREDIYLVSGTGDAKGVLPDRIFAYEEKNDFLADIDFLILALPLTPQTKGIIGEAELKRLKPIAYVLNPARGPLIKEDALLRALRETWIAGAALDTHYQYPMPADHPLWKFPNVIMTPHISGSGDSPHYLERIWELFMQNVQRSQANEPFLNEIARSQLLSSKN